MPLQKNTAARNEHIAAVGATWDGGTVEIYTGPQPGSPNSAPSGSLLCTINIPNPAFGSPSGGAISKAGSWQDAATATGTAGWARFISADTTKSMDVAVTDAMGGNDLLINDVDITIGNTVTIVSLVLTEPES